MPKLGPDSKEYSFSLNCISRIKTSSQVGMKLLLKILANLARISVLGQNEMCPNLGHTPMFFLLGRQTRFWRTPAPGSCSARSHDRLCSCAASHHVATAGCARDLASRPGSLPYPGRSNCIQLSRCTVLRILPLIYNRCENPVFERVWGNIFSSPPF